MSRFDAPYDGAKIVELCRQKGMYLEDLAEVAGIDIGTLRNIRMTGSGKMPVIRSIADALGVSFATLLTEEFKNGY